MDECKAYLRIRRLSDNSIVHSTGVRNISEHHVDTVIAGMLRNVADGFYIDDSEVEAAREKETDRLKLTKSPAA